MSTPRSNTSPTSTHDRPATVRWRGRLGATVIGLLLIMTVGACGGNDEVTDASSSTASASTTTPAAESAAGNEAPTAEAPTSQVDSLPLTAESVAGIWYEDPGSGYWVEPIMARFASDGTFSLGGVFVAESWINGTYALGDQAITFTATSGGCASRDTFTWDVVIVADGRLEGVHAGSDGDISGLVGECPIPVGEPYNLTRVSPTSPAAAGITAAEYRGPALTSDTSSVALEGYWLVEGTGYLLRWDYTGRYHLDDVGQIATNPQDAGRAEIGPQTLSFTSGGDADGCAEGDVMAWEDVRVEDGQLRGVVNGDSCDRGIGSEVTLLFLGASTA